MFDFLRKRLKIVRRTPGRNSWSAGIFTINDIISHYYIAYVLMPKFSNFSNVTDSEMQLLYAIKHDLRVNWAYMIMHHMTSHNDFCSGLPYAY